jgi:bifunctional isochorismate lyase / aryl carrier protein
MWGTADARPTALLVLDVQNYFFDQKSPAYLPSVPAVLPHINELGAHAGRHGWLVVATTHHAPSEPGNLMAEKWRHHPYGSECLLFPGLTLDPRVRTISKEHYSAFFRTDLEGILRSQAIERIVICGVMTHLCVDTTTRHAFMLGFRSIVVSDACCSKTEAYHAFALAALAHGFAHIATAREVMDPGVSPCSTS